MIVQNNCPLSPPKFGVHVSFGEINIFFLISGAQERSQNNYSDLPAFRPVSSCDILLQKSHHFCSYSGILMLILHGLSESNINAFGSQVPSCSRIFSTVAACVSGSSDSHDSGHKTDVGIKRGWGREKRTKLVRMM